MLKDQVVFITGASSGIGALCAQMLIEEGAIPILAARSRDKLEEIGASLNGQHELLTLDVTNDEQVQAAISNMLEKYGRIDILLNNAGYGKFAAMTDMTVQEFDEMMDVNYMGIVRCTKAVLPHMLKRGTGQIVNVASMAGKIGTAKSASYTATKHAVLGFSNALRQELRKTGVKVTTINPGPIDTPFFHRADPSGNYVNNVRWMMLKPEDVARHMVQAMKKRKEEVNLPRMASAGIWLYQLFPRLADRLSHGFMNQK
ncbi:oxidoreductase [Paenibacillus sp. Root52]|uniref:SDR family NAD(P)-dependent oxidoreductase n=1 Tax=unclassified Paenibacillus TaxID=185978 RepID=UPI0006F515BA|nr:MULTISPECIES: SDR family oxidoreductase [unclassified Paenibacillus]KQY80696.1 oxidoreductase [Paenibacillus sp. Root52]MCG7380578.1 SDR family oxidoreductase [Paenibacillus sp. ACRSA]